MITARVVDITTLSVDAIVNAANRDLAPGAGVCGAIHHKAGPALAQLTQKLRSIAFPAISTGIYGYPLQAATRIAIATVRAELAEPGSISEVVFACFSAEVLAAYAAEGI